MLGRWIKMLLNWALKAGILLALGAISGSLWLQYKYQDPIWHSISRGLKPELDWQRPKYPSLAVFFDIAYASLAMDPRDDYGFVLGSSQRIDPANLAFGPVGPKPSALEKPVYYDAEGHPLALDQQGFSSQAAWSRFPAPIPKFVASADEIIAAVNNAQPGDHILILPGTYRLSGRSMHLKARGSVDAPIFLRASSFGDVTLELALIEGFVVRGPYWVFENLVLRGVCEKDSNCEHAFHIVGQAHSTVVRNVMAVNFNAAMKINRLKDDFPDYGLIESSLFANEWPRQTKNPVTPVDLVAADSWVVTKNVFADFAKQGGNQVSYGAFFKGASSNGIFDRNLVMCEWQHHGGIRVGLSFGGGGTYQGACRDNQCAFEHSGGTMQANIIMNCPNDIGVYVNRSPNSAIYNNIITHTHGLDVRFRESSAKVFNNIIDGRISVRDDAQLDDRHNLTSWWRSAFLANVSDALFDAPEEGNFTPVYKSAIIRKGVGLDNPILDFCGVPMQDDRPDIGALGIDTAAYCGNLTNATP